MTILIDENVTGIVANYSIACTSWFITSSALMASGTYSCQQSQNLYDIKYI